MMDIAFHIIPLVTAVGNEELVSVSSLLFDHTRGIIGMTICHLSFSYHTGIALFSHPYSIGAKKLSSHRELYHTTVILLFSLLLIDADLYRLPSFIFSLYTFRLLEFQFPFPLAVMTITFSLFKIFFCDCVSGFVLRSSILPHHHVSAAQLTTKTLSGWLFI